jgi:hypothetical protein
MERRIFSLVEEPKNELYRQLLASAEQEASLAYLILRPNIAVNNTAEAVIDQLKPYEISRQEVSEWPGTRLMYGARALRFEYIVSHELITTLATVANGIYDWVLPNLPEDLGFLRSDHSTWFATIAHERDAYFELTAAEMDQIITRIPALGGLIKGEDLIE